MHHAWQILQPCARQDAHTPMSLSLHPVPVVSDGEEREEERVSHIFCADGGDGNETDDVSGSAVRLPAGVWGCLVCRCVEEEIHRCSLSWIARVEFPGSSGWEVGPPTPQWGRGPWRRAQGTHGRAAPRSVALHMHDLCLCTVGDAQPPASHPRPCLAGVL